jgi:replication-associated recombination protein RarA
MGKKNEEKEQREMFSLKEDKIRGEKEKKSLGYEKFNYDRFEVISAFIKEMRLGNVEGALYWLDVMKRSNEPKNYIVKRLVCFAGEDAFGTEPLGIASHLVNTFGREGDDWNLIDQAVIHLTKCKKWWETETGAFWKKCQMRHSKLFKLGKLKKVPHYALDVHTRKGVELKSQGLMDSRMSGDANGVAKRLDSFERHGRFVWDKTLRGWKSYLEENFLDEKGDWKKNGE